MPGTLLKAAPARAIATPLAALALVLGGCGGDDEGTIPDQASQNLLTRLQGVEREVDAGRCATAEIEAEGFVDDVASLEGRIEQEVYEALREAGEQLLALTRDQCTAESGASGPQGETSVPEEETVAPPPEETPEQTTTDEEPAGEQPQNEGSQDHGPGGRGPGQGGGQNQPSPGGESVPGPGGDSGQSGGPNQGGGPPNTGGVTPGAEKGKPR